MEKALDFYRGHGMMTEVKTMKHMIKDIPKDIPSIVSIVQNVLLHKAWAERYGVELKGKKHEEPWLRSVEEKLIHLDKLGYKHVQHKKSIENKILGICRDFSVMAAALCIEAGIPARARCGFATYFESGKYIDHWVAEYWNENIKRWVMVDAQLDNFQQKELDIAFNTLDVDEQYFITAPRAWKMCREGKADPELFGIFQWWGYDYLKCNLLLDANSLLKVPMQPWDIWEGYKKLPVSEWSDYDFSIMDQLSSYVLDVDDDIDVLCAFVQQNDKIRVPRDLVGVINTLT